LNLLVLLWGWWSDSKRDSWWSSRIFSRLLLSSI
jgi:hypothetical protein